MINSENLDCIWSSSRTTKEICRISSICMLTLYSIVNGYKFLELKSLIISAKKINTEEASEEVKEQESALLKQ